MRRRSSADHHGTEARVYRETENALLQRFAEERQRRTAGKPPAMLRLVGDENSGAIYRSPDAVEWYTAACRRAPGNTPEVTLRSVEYARACDPVDYCDALRAVLCGPAVL